METRTVAPGTVDSLRDTAKRPEALEALVAARGDGLGCRACGVLEGSSIGAVAEGRMKVRLLRCALCEVTKYCTSQCQRSDWKRHKRDECAHHKADSHLDPRVQDEHSREDFRDAAVYWMDQCEAEMRYAARCALRPGLNGDTSATHTLVVEWVFEPKERRRRFQFALVKATVVTNKHAADELRARDGGHASRLASEERLAKHGPPPPGIIPLAVLSFFRTADSQHLHHSHALIPHPLDRLNLIDPDWLAILRQSLSDSTIPSDVELLLQQLQARADGGLAEAIEQGFADEDGEWTVDGMRGSSVPKPSTGVAKQKKKKKKKKTKGAEADAPNAALVALGPDEGDHDFDGPLAIYED